MIKPIEADIGRKIVLVRGFHMKDLIGNIAHLEGELSEHHIYVNVEGFELPVLFKKESSFWFEDYKKA